MSFLRNILVFAFVHSSLLFDEARSTFIIPTPSPPGHVDLSLPGPAQHPPALYYHQPQQHQAPLQQLQQAPLNLEQQQHLQPFPLQQQSQPLPFQQPQQQPLSMPPYQRQQHLTQQEPLSVPPQHPPPVPPLPPQKPPHIPPLPLQQLPPVQSLLPQEPPPVPPLPPQQPSPAPQLPPKQPPPELPLPAHQPPMTEPQQTQSMPPQSPSQPKPRPPPQLPPSFSSPLVNDKPHEKHHRHHEQILEHHPHKYELDIDKSKPSESSKTKWGPQLPNSVMDSRASIVYEYDFVEPNPPPSPAPVFSYHKKLNNMVPTKSHLVPQSYKPQVTRCLKPRQKYPINYVYNPTAIQKPALKVYPSINQLLAFRKALKYTGRHRNTLVKYNVPKFSNPPPPTVPRMSLAERQNEGPPLYSNYPITAVISAAAARGITCRPLYHVYSLLPMTSYPSYCGRTLSCPSPLVTEVQVGRTCLCCSSFDTTTSVIRDRRNTD